MKSRHSVGNWEDTRRLVLVRDEYKCVSYSMAEEQLDIADRMCTAAHSSRADYDRLGCFDEVLSQWFSII
ncbi:MAG: hypothetical protein AAAC47_11025, partial [Pararhizobium sp.]